MKRFSFEKLTVWQKSRKRSVFIYEVTKSFPDDERFGLISQMRQCAISISSNIAEGSGRHSGKDKARYKEIAFSSALELLNQIIIANDLQFISNKNHDVLRDNISKITSNAKQLAQISIKISS